MYKYLKYTIDFIASIFALIILFPFLLLVIIFLSFANKGAGVFFLQERPGRNSKPFKIIKFKTMTEERNNDRNLLPDADRLTKVGKLIRSLSIDELPQLVNVLKGDMSFIGPRPLLFRYVPLYSKEQYRRHDVRPGISGWAQVNGRNNITWTKKFELDIWYVDNISFVLDIKILYLTILKILKQSGISKDGSATTVAYNGEN